MSDITKLVSANILFSLIFKFVGLCLSILIVSLASKQSDLLVEQILLFQVSLGYFSIFDLGVPSHLKSQAYNGGSNNPAVWLTWLVVLTLSFALLGHAAEITVFKNFETPAVVGAIFAAIFVKFATGYFQSKHNFGASYAIQIWIPFLLMFYLLAFDVLNAVRWDIFVIVACAGLIVVFMCVTRPDFQMISRTWYQDLRGGLVFFGAQVMTVLVFGLHEYIFLFSGQSFLGWSVESRYYLLISALGPVISNLFWAYLTHANVKRPLYVLFFAITSMFIWGGLVLVFHDAFFAFFWPQYKNLVTDANAIYIWVFFMSHTAVLIVSGYLYAAGKSYIVFWALCVLLLVRIATFGGDIFGFELFSIYEANCILGVVSFVIFIGVFAHRSFRS